MYQEKSFALANLPLQARWPSDTATATNWRLKMINEKENLHKCYNGVRFPSFVKPLPGDRFGSKIMAQGTSGPKLLANYPIYSYTTYDIYDRVIWMNLELEAGGFKTVPVFPIEDLPIEGKVETPTRKKQTQEVARRRG